MRRVALTFCPGSASVVLSVFLVALCGCSRLEWPQTSTPTLTNSAAINRALDSSSLSRSDRPFHLIMEIQPPPHSSADTDRSHAEVEVFWLNPITYRTQIRSGSFSQTRIVNGAVVEEHNQGNFYPRWIQNFVDALLDPVPHARELGRMPGEIPVGATANACISIATGTKSTAAADSTNTPAQSPAQVCFEDTEPRMVSSADLDRSIYYNDFEPYGSQQIARTLIDALPTKLRAQGRIVRLEPLAPSSEALLKAMEFTPPEKQLRTALVPSDTAVALLDFSAPALKAQPGHPGHPVRSAAAGEESTAPQQKASSSTGLPFESEVQAAESASPVSAPGPVTVHVRTDLTGRVQEAYPESSDPLGMENPVALQAAVERALRLKFKPLVVNGVPRQMEATINLP